MSIQDMTNLWNGWNKAESFTVIIVASDEEEAMDIVREYGNDAGLTDDWAILEFDASCEVDCDYILMGE